eukprot:7557937-Pyramimonas_sp.AAC.1
MVGSCALTCTGSELALDIAPPATIRSDLLERNGISLHVVNANELPRERDARVGARVERQRRASADVIYNISNNLRQER